MRRIAWIAAFFAAIWLSACGGSSSKSPNTTPNEPGDPSITQPEPQPEPKFGQGTIEVLSNHAELISGGDALIRVVADNPEELTGATLNIGKKDATAALVPQEDGSLMGLVEGLALGENTLTVTLASSAILTRTITNHPKGGPVISGPQVQPWKCTNTAQQLDEQCNQAPEFSFKYLPAKAYMSFVDNMKKVADRIDGPEDLIDIPMDLLKIGISGQALENYDPENPPNTSDIATTVTDTGAEVPFIVRVERGVINRDRYQIMVLYDPSEPWDAINPQPQWNQKLLIHHGSNVGVEFGMANPPTTELGNGIVVALSRGFATMSTAQGNLGHNANLVTGAESLMMVKEHLIENYGPLRYTIGTGCSGGAIMQLHVANAYPGIYQGLIVQCAYPDVWTTAVQFADYHLLNKQFDWQLPSEPMDVPLVLKSVLADPGPVPMISFYGHLPINPIASDAAFFPAAFPDQEKCRGIDDTSLLYHPTDNPEGIRCGLVDWMHNQFGPREVADWGPVEEQISRGFTGVPFDNIGVQYGLAALQSGLISGETFLELNRNIGGLDVDFRRQDERNKANMQALSNAYRTGAINTTDNMNDLPIIDLRGLDPGAAHDAFHSWQLRERLQQAHGNADNHVIWFGPVPVAGDTIYTTQALLVMDDWLAKVEAADEEALLAEKVRTARPVQARDRCLSVSSLFDEEHIPPLLGPLFYPNPVIPYLSLEPLPAAPDQFGLVVDAVTNQACGINIEHLTNISELLQLPDGGAIGDVLANITQPLDQLLKPVTDLQSTVVTTRFGTPRTVAGDSIATLTNKCVLKEVEPQDYATAPFISLTDPAGLAKELASKMMEGASDPASIPDIIKGLLPSVITDPLSLADKLTGLLEAGMQDPTSLPTSILETLATRLTPDPEHFAEKVRELFPEGVCDYTQAPVAQAKTIPWLRYGDAEQVVYGGEPIESEESENLPQGWVSAGF